MRFRILLTNGKLTHDIVWLEHTGEDVYLGYVGADNKYSYHQSGKRHQKFSDGRVILYEKHHPLKNFKGQFELCSFGFSPRSKWKKTYGGKKSDSALYLDARTLPDNLTIRVGLLEPGKFDAMASAHFPEVLDLWSMHLITATVPWVYAAVQSVKPEVWKIAKTLSNHALDRTAANEE